MAGYPGRWPSLYPPVANLLTEGEQPPVDPLSVPLSPEPLPTWNGREDRVAWVLHNFTPGEKAKLYQTQHNGENMRLDRCNDIIRKEKADLAKAAKKEAWP